MNIAGGIWQEESKGQGVSLFPMHQHGSEFEILAAHH
jgi:hypothetical protein